MNFIKTGATAISNALGRGGDGQDPNDGDSNNVRAPAPTLQPTKQSMRGETEFEDKFKKMLDDDKNNAKWLKPHIFDGTYKTYYGEYKKAWGDPEKTKTPSQENRIFDNLLKTLKEGATITAKGKTATQINPKPSKESKKANKPAPNGETTPTGSKRDVNSKPAGAVPGLNMANVASTTTKEDGKAGLLLPPGATPASKELKPPAKPDQKCIQPPSNTQETDNRRAPTITITVEIHNDSKYAIVLKDSDHKEKEKVFGVVKSKGVKKVMVPVELGTVVKLTPYAVVENERVEHNSFRRDGKGLVFEVSQKEEGQQFTVDSTDEVKKRVKRVKRVKRKPAQTDPPPDAEAPKAAVADHKGHLVHTNEGKPHKKRKPSPMDRPVEKEAPAATDNAATGSFSATESNEDIRVAKKDADTMSVNPMEDAENIANWSCQSKPASDVGKDGAANIDGKEKGSVDPVLPTTKPDSSTVGAAREQEHTREGVGTFKTERSLFHSPASRESEASLVGDKKEETTAASPDKKQDPKDDIPKKQDPKDYIPKVVATRPSDDNHKETTPASDVEQNQSRATVQYLLSDDGGGKIGAVRDNKVNVVAKHGLDTMAANPNDREANDYKPVPKRRRTDVTGATSNANNKCPAEDSNKKLDSAEHSKVESEAPMQMDTVSDKATAQGASLTDPKPFEEAPTKDSSNDESKVDSSNDESKAENADPKKLCAPEKPTAKAASSSSSKSMLNAVSLGEDNTTSKSSPQDGHKKHKPMDHSSSNKSVPLPASTPHQEEKEPMSQEDTCLNLPKSFDNDGSPKAGAHYPEPAKPKGTPPVNESNAGKPAPGDKSNVKSGKEESGKQRPAMASGAPAEMPGVKPPGPKNAPKSPSLKSSSSVKETVNPRIEGRKHNRSDEAINERPNKRLKSSHAAPPANAISKEDPAEATGVTPSNTPSEPGSSLAASEEIRLSKANETENPGETKGPRDSKGLSRTLVAAGVGENDKATAGKDDCTVHSQNSQKQDDHQGSERDKRVSKECKLQPGSRASCSDKAAASKANTVTQQEPAALDNATANDIVSSNASSTHDETSTEGADASESTPAQQSSTGARTAAARTFSSVEPVVNHPSSTVFKAAARNNKDAASKRGPSLMQSKLAPPICSKDDATIDIEKPSDRAGMGTQGATPGMEEETAKLMETDDEVPCKDGIVGETTSVPNKNPDCSKDNKDKPEENPAILSQNEKALDGNKQEATKKGANLKEAPSRLALPTDKAATTPTDEKESTVDPQAPTMPSSSSVAIGTSKPMKGAEDLQCPPTVPKSGKGAPEKKPKAMNSNATIHKKKDAQPDNRTAASSNTPSANKANMALLEISSKKPATVDPPKKAESVEATKTPTKEKGSMGPPAQKASDKTSRKASVLGTKTPKETKIGEKSSSASSDSSPMILDTPDGAKIGGNSPSTITSPGDEVFGSPGGDDVMSSPDDEHNTQESGAMGNAPNQSSIVFASKGGSFIPKIHAELPEVQKDRSQAKSPPTATTDQNDTKSFPHIMGTQGAAPGMQEETAKMMETVPCKEGVIGTGKVTSAPIPGGQSKTHECSKDNKKKSATAGKEDQEKVTGDNKSNKQEAAKKAASLMETPSRQALPAEKVGTGTPKYKKKSAADTHVPTMPASSYSATGTSKLNKGAKDPKCPPDAPIQPSGVATKPSGATTNESAELGASKEPPVQSSSISKATADDASRGSSNVLTQQGMPAQEVNSAKVPSAPIDNIGSHSPKKHAKLAEGQGQAKSPPSAPTSLPGEASLTSTSGEATDSQKDQKSFPRIVGDSSSNEQEYKEAKTLDPDRFKGSRISFLVFLDEKDEEPQWMPAHEFTKNNNDHDRIEKLAEYCKATMVDKLHDGGKYNGEKVRKPDGSVEQVPLGQATGGRYFVSHQRTGDPARVNKEAANKRATFCTDKLDFGGVEENLEDLEAKPAARKNGTESPNHTGLGTGNDGDMEDFGVLDGGNDTPDTPEQATPPKQGKVGPQDEDNGYYFMTRKEFMGTEGNFVGSDSEGKHCTADACTTAAVKLFPEFYEAGKKTQDRIRSQLSPDGKAVGIFKMTEWFRSQKHPVTRKPLFDVGILPTEYRNKKYDTLQMKDGVWIITIDYWVDGQNMDKDPPKDQKHALNYIVTPRKQENKPPLRLFFENTARAKIMVIEEEDIKDESNAKKAFNRQFDLACKIVIKRQFCILKHGKESEQSYLRKLLNWSQTEVKPEEVGVYKAKPMSKFKWVGGNNFEPKSSRGSKSNSNKDNNNKGKSGKNAKGPGGNKAKAPGSSSNNNNKGGRTSNNRAK